MIKHFPGIILATWKVFHKDEESEAEILSLTSIQILQMVVSIVNENKYESTWSNI